MITVRTYSPDRDRTGKFVRRYPLGLMIEDERGVVWYVFDKDVVSPRIEEIDAQLKPRAAPAPNVPGDNSAIW